MPIECIVLWAGMHVTVAKVGLYKRKSIQYLSELHSVHQTTFCAEEFFAALNYVYRSKFFKSAIKLATVSKYNPSSAGKPSTGNSLSNLPPSGEVTSVGKYSSAGLDSDPPLIDPPSVDPPSVDPPSGEPPWGELPLSNSR